MDEQDALSREVAAACDAWMVPGVEVWFGCGRFRYVAAADCDEAEVASGGEISYVPISELRPNLRDPVTVNALLGQGMVWPSRLGFTARICMDGEREESSRTFAIARAWIAAHTKEKANA